MKIEMEHANGEFIRGEHTGHTAPYALCVMLFNMFRRLVLGAYCVVNRGIPAHNEGMLDRSRNFTDRMSFTMANYCRASANEQNLKIPTLVQLSECDYASAAAAARSCVRTA